MRCTDGNTQSPFRDDVRWGASLAIRSWSRYRSPKRANEAIEEFGEFLGHATQMTRVLLTGRGKSGTTWVTRILNAHPRIAMTGERKLLAQNGPYEPLLRPFVTGAAMREWGRVTSLRERLEVGEELGTELARLVYDYLLARTVDLEGLTHLGDKVPLTYPDDVPVTLTAMDRMFPELRVVHVVRDGRDVAVSHVFHKYRRLASPEDHALFLKRIEHRRRTGEGRIFADADLRSIASSWAGVVASIDRHGRDRFGDRMLTVRYEDLLADTPGRVSEIYDHVGLPWTEATIRDVAEATSFETMSGGRAAGEEDSESFFRKGIAGDWANYFSEEDAAIFREIAGNTLSRFGYAGGREEAPPRAS